MFATYTPKRDWAIELFLDQREEERLREEGYTDCFTDNSDEEIDFWENLWSNEALIDEIDRLSDLCDGMVYDELTD